MLNEKMIVTGSNAVRCRRLKELDREDARKRPGGIAVSELTYTVSSGTLNSSIPYHIWWDCVKDDMESLVLSQNDAQFRNKWRRRSKGTTG